MSGVLVIAEHDNQRVKAATLHCLTAAAQLSDNITVLVFGFQCQAVVSALQVYSVVRVIKVVDAKDFQYQLAETIAPVVVSLISEFSYIIAPATSFGKNLLPRIAAMCDVGQISDVTKIENENTYQRPIYAGNAIATVQSHDELQVLTIRTTAFEAVVADESHQAAVETIEFESSNQQSKFISHQLHQSERPELVAADIIIAGGRGLKDKAGFERLTKIADRMGAAIGASRAAVDAEMAPNDFQVGQTGKIVAPQLYIAVGISGAIQHLAGMKDSKIIVAINKDSDAAIFQVADYGLVADIQQVLPTWERALDEIEQ